MLTLWGSQHWQTALASGTLPCMKHVTICVHHGNLFPFLKNLTLMVSEVFGGSLCTMRNLEQITFVDCSGFIAEVLQAIVSLLPMLKLIAFHATNQPRIEPVELPTAARRS